MSFQTKAFVAILVLTCFCGIQCKRSGRSRGSSRSSSNYSRAKQGTHDITSLSYTNFGANKRPESEHHVDGDFPQYPPSHQSIQKQDVSKVAGSAPTALDSRFNSPPNNQGIDHINRQAVNPLNSPNPQKPVGWNVGGNEPVNKNNDFIVGSSYFNHPGHFQNSNSPGVSSFPHDVNLDKYPKTAYPNTGSYNYYGVGNNYNYGNGYQYEPDEPFQRYRPTSNIGVVPPKNANLGDYYSNMLGISNLPTFAQHSSNAGLFGRLFGGQTHTAYGYGGYGFGNNAYKNVLAGLLIWNLMQGLTSHRYNVYNYYNHPELIPQNVSLQADNVVVCPENATMICDSFTSALCTSNSTVFCVIRANATMPCDNNSTAFCINTTGACADSTDFECNNDIKCVTNVTIFGKIDFNTTKFNSSLNIFNEETNETVLCITTLAVPQVENKGTADEYPCNSESVMPCSLSATPINNSDNEDPTNHQFNEVEITTDNSV